MLRVVLMYLAWTTSLTTPVSAQGNELSKPSLIRAIEVARSAIEAKRVGAEGRQAQIDISPDGTACVYTVIEPNIKADRFVANLWLIETRDGAIPRLIASTSPTRSSNPIATPRFSPDGRQIAYFEARNEGIRLIIITLKTGVARVAGEKADGRGWDASWNVRVDGGLQWSPDGRSIAVGVLERDRNREEPEAADTDLTWSEDIDNSDTSGIALIDPASGDSTLISNSGLYIRDFDWSPDGESFVVSANRREQARCWWMYTDIYLLRLATRKFSPLVVQPGMDWQSTWSPDGRQVAFLSSGGVIDWSQRTIIGIVNVETRVVTYPSRAEIMRISADARSKPIWEPNGKSVLVRLANNLTFKVVEVAADGVGIRNLSTESLASFDNLRMARSSTAIAYTKQEFEETRDLYMALDSTSRPTRLTYFGDSFKSAIHARSQSEVVSWRSSDGQWTIHGGLSSTSDSFGRKVRGSKPLLVFAEGGPTMVQMEFNLNGQFPFIAFAESGVAVLAPNTRGRSGYGKKFLSALREEGHWGSGPFSDILAGVDYVSRTRGIGGDGQLGIVGHSYGGYLVAFAITHTNRFKAAEIFDSAGPPLFPGDLYKWGANPQVLGVMRALYGMGSPFDPSEFAAIDQESPLPRIGRARTPTLLEYGSADAGGADKTDGVALFQGLRYFNVPSKFIRLRFIGHRVSEFGPAEQMDSAQRDLRWYWHWVFGSDDPEVIRKYGRSTDSVLQ